MAAAIRRPAIVLPAIILLGLGAGAGVLALRHAGATPSGDVVRVHLDGQVARLTLAHGAIRLLGTPAPAIEANDRVVVTGTRDAATLMVDFRAGNPIPAGGLAFHGALASGDRLVLGSGSFDDVRHAVTGPDRGRFVLRRGSSRSVIEYAGVAGVADRTIALDRTLALEHSTEAIHRTLHQVTGGRIMLGSRGAGSATFAKPSGSLFLDVHSPLVVGALTADGAVLIGAHSPLTIGA
ncbi:MAG TPA: hypothetical protein VNN79_14025, partial [Actinomycetota bacterium]|nr:hypothetical protein [Actinomycetota bacterium]